MSAVKGMARVGNAHLHVRQSQNNPYQTDKERWQEEIELDSLEKENEGMENNSGTE